VVSTLTIIKERTSKGLVPTFRGPDGKEGKALARKKGGISEECL